jgi:hypothetical protein
MSSQARRPASARAGTAALFGLLLLALLVAPAAASADTGDDAEGAWTFAVYVAADNNLESSWDDVSLPALLRVSNDANVRIVAMVDRLSTEGTEFVEIRDGEQFPIDLGEDEPGELNTGDGASFKWFLDTVAELYPSTNLAVTMWDHGYAWRYVCSDDSSDGDRITMAELHAALEEAGEHIDILAFDACAMGDVAVAYELAATGMVDYMVGSEEMVPLDGFAYDLMLAPLAETPSLTPAEVAVDMVDGWGQYYDPLKWAKSVCLSAVDVRAIGDAAPALQTWASELAAGLPDDAGVYRKVLIKTWRATQTRQYDLVGLCERLAGDPALEDTGVPAASTAVAQAVSAAVLATHCTRWNEGATGLTVWWGNIGDWKYYGDPFVDVLFAQPIGDGGVGWYDFLLAYNAR